MPWELEKEAAAHISIGKGARAEGRGKREEREEEAKSKEQKHFWLAVWAHHLGKGHHNSNSSPVLIEKSVVLLWLGRRCYRSSKSITLLVTQK